MRFDRIEAMKLTGAAIKQMLTAATMATLLASATCAGEALVEYPTEHAPCRYLETGRQDLEAAGYDKDNPENRIQFSWFHQPKEGQGECSYKAGQDNSCERVSYLVRVRTGCFLGMCRKVQVVYHYDGGLKPSDFCRVDYSLNDQSI